MCSTRYIDCSTCYVALVDRREELLEAVVGHVMEHGLIGLTLRPLAAAVGTSDRMLIYHFGSRDELVSAVLGRCADLAIEALSALPAAPGVRRGVNALWSAYREEPLAGYLRVYLQAAATGLLGEEPILGETRAANERWSAALADFLVRCGAPRRRVRRIVTLVDSALYGFHLDLTTDRPDELARGVDDLARAAQALAGRPVS